MCITLTLPDGRWVVGIDALDDALGFEAPIEVGYPILKGANRCTCLCPVDLVALSERMQWKIESDLSGDPMRKIASNLARKAKQ